ncbi:MAG: alkaline phosphatase family protein [Asgard group archaeon]|nr:alkaline phosphatase family protein [Asgard group archaeon]
MNLKNNKGLLIVLLVSMVVIIGSIPITYIIIKNNVGNYPDTYVMVFNESQNLANITVSVFFDISNNSQELNIDTILTKCNISSYETIYFISTNEYYLLLTKKMVEESKLGLNEMGFYLKTSEILYKNVIGMALDITYGTINIAPTIFSALDIPITSNYANSTYSFDEETIEKVVIILLDGFGWRFWANLSQLGIVDFGNDLLFNEKALTAFPPITNVATATILSGFWPATTGIMCRNDHQLKVPSIFDKASAQGLSTEYFEGNVGFIDISADEEHWILDINGDGLTDEEIFAVANESISTDQKDVSFIHFHGIDDIGHEFGPYSLEWLDKVQELNNMTNKLIQQSSENTLFIITADHGMHKNLNPKVSGRLGIHGNCIYEDMLVPLILKIK